MGKKYLAFDVGGTTIKYGLIDEDLNLSNCNKIPTNQNANNHILNTLKKVTEEIQSTNELSGIGISTAGIVAPDGSIQYAGPTIPDYINTPLKSALTEQSKVSVNVINDVNAALLGELYVSELIDHNIYCITLGTGIGGAYYQEGKLIGGAHGQGNSIGYTMFDHETKTNYEQRASTLVLERKLAKHEITVIEAFDKAKSGDEFCMEMLKNWAQEVARGLAEIIVLFDPKYIIIGGAVAVQGDYLLNLLNHALKEILPKNFNKTILKVATQGNDAQLIGSIVPFLKKREEV